MTVQKQLFGEGKHVEFKAKMPKNHENFLKDIIAFSNSSGGKTIIGVEDGTGKVIGLGEKNPFKLSDDISNMISDACTPQIYMEITPKTIEEKTVLEVEVFPGRFRPYYIAAKGKDKSTYIRVNGTSRPADERKIRELELEGQRIPYDMMKDIGAAFDMDAAKALMNDMYQRALDACRSDVEREQVRPLTTQKLEDFGVVCKDGKDYVPTHAFTLLTHPRERYVMIQCALFKGNDRSEFIDKKEMRGSIQQQIEDAYSFVLRHINQGAFIEGLYRHDEYELPVQSIREVIANACLHRSYQDPSSIQVSIYDNRIEVDSPGMLYDGLNVEEVLSGKSKCRNVAIAEAFHYMKIIEGWGTGIPRVFRQCMEMGLPEPQFEEMGDGIKVTIYRIENSEANESNNESNNEANESNNEANESNNEANEANNEANEANNEANEANNESNNETNQESIEEQILRAIQTDSQISQRNLAKELGVSRSTIQRYFAKMIDDGKIHRVDGTRGSWNITDS